MFEFGDSGREFGLVRLTGGDAVFHFGESCLEASKGAAVTGLCVGERGEQSL